MQLRARVPQLGSGAAKEINECLKNKSLALKVGRVVERKKRVWNFSQGSTTDWSSGIELLWVCLHRGYTNTR